MDAKLTEVFASRLVGWMLTARDYAKSSEYYRNLLVQIGRDFGHAAYVADDGTVMEDPIVAKIPELVQALLKKQ